MFSCPTSNGMNPARKGLYFLLATLIGVGVLSYFIFAPFLTALIMAAVFAVTFHSLHQWILKRLGKWKSIAALLTVIVAVVGIITPLAMIGTQIVYQAADVYVSLVYGDGKEQVNSVVASADAFLGA